jgi:glutamate dehydrogenase (NAD(P)+)
MPMEDVFRFADELGPAKILHVYEPSTGLKATLVLTSAPRNVRGWRGP